jgi:hypothetical protein
LLPSSEGVGAFLLTANLQSILDPHKNFYTFHSVFDILRIKIRSKKKNENGELAWKIVSSTSSPVDFKNPKLPR